MRRSDAQSFALGLDAGDHLVAQSVDVGVDNDALGDKMIACIEAKRAALGI